MSKNKYFNKLNTKPAIDSLINSALITIVVFSVFFITYAHKAFIKSRCKEIGLYSILGMSEADIIAMILYENLIIGAVSIFSGLMLGTIMMKPFINVMCRISGIVPFTLVLNIQSYLSAIVIFTVIFIAGSLTIIFTLDFTNLNSIMKQSRIKEKISSANYKKAIIGFVLMFSCIIVLRIFIDSKKITSIIPFSIVVCLCSLDLIISYLGALVLKLASKNDRIYYNNILSITDMSHKFIQNKKVFFVTSILMAFIIFMAGAAFSFKKTTRYYSELWNPHNMSFAEVLNMNQISRQKLINIVSKKDSNLKKCNNMEFMLITKADTAAELSDLEDRTIIVSAKNYNEVMNSKIKVRRNKAVLANLSKEEYGDSMYRVNCNKYQRNFNITREIQDPFYNIHTNTLGFAKFLLIVNDYDYKYMKTRLSNNQIGTYNVFDFKNWRKSANTVSNLEDALGKMNPKQNSYYSNMFAMSSTIGTYNDMESDNGFILFICGFIGILFFMAVCSILYFKTYAYIDDLKLKYKKLHRMGMSHNEMKKQISRELKIVFFVPFIFGVIVGCMYLFTLFNAGGLTKMYPYSLNVILVCFLVNCIYFCKCKAVFCSKILGKH